MNFSSVRYLVREGFRNIWQNRFMAIASVCVLVSCLILTGSAYMVFVNIEHTFEWVYGQNVVVAFAREDCTPQQLDTLKDKIAGITNVAKVEFVSKEQSLLKYKDTMPEALYQDMQGENNPYLDAFVVTFKDLNKFDYTITQIKQIPEIDSTFYDENVAAALTKIRRAVLMVGGAIVLMLFAVSLFIIANTIKLTVYNRRLEISIMKSVGATDAFVRIPFMLEGMVLGLASGGLSYIIIYLIYRKIFQLFGSGYLGGLVSFSAVWSTLLVGFICIGVVTGIAGSSFSMRKYLRKQGGISGVLQ